MKFNLLGPLEVRDDAGALVALRRQPRQTLTALLLLAGPPVSRERLVAALWGGTRLADPSLALRQRIHELRSALRSAGAAKRLETHDRAYRLRVEPDELDAHAFTSLTKLGRAALEAGDAEVAAGLLQQAAGLWRDPPWADLPQTPTMEEAARRLDDLRADAVEALLEARLEIGEHREVIGPLREAVAVDPLREHTCALLMQALHRSGLTSDALAAYSSASRALARELGTDPGPELTRLQQAILAGDPAPFAGPSPAPAAAAVSRTSWAPLCQLPAPPADFTGRGADIEAVGEQLTGAEMTVTVLTGPAGTGKTALALYCGQRFRDSFPGGQLYADLGGSTQGRDPQEVLAELLRALGVARVPAAAAEREALYRALLARGKVLVIADDAATAGQVRPLLPGTAGSAVLVTSRSRLPGLEAARLVVVGELPGDEAVALLSKTAGDGGGIGEDSAALAAIAARCDGLPLALRIAGARLATDPALTARALARALASEDRRLAELAAGDLSVTARLDAACELLGERDRRAFRLLSAHPTGDIPGWLIPVLLADPSAASAGEAMVSAGLLEAVAALAGGARRYRMHSLTRLYAAQRARREETRDVLGAAAGRMFAAWLELADGADRQLPRHPYVPAPAVLPPPAVLAPAERAAITTPAREWFAAENANLLAVTLKACAHDYALAGELAGRQFSAQCERGDLKAARQLWAAVAAAAARAGGELAAAGARYRGAVLALEEDGRDRRVVRALTGCLLVFGGAGWAYRRALADVHHMLALCAIADDDPASAQRHAEEGLEAARREDEPRITFLCLSALGIVLAGRGRTVEGVAHCQDALSRAEALGDPGYIDAARRARDRARIFTPGTWGWRLPAAGEPSRQPPMTA